MKIKRKSNIGKILAAVAAVIVLAGAVGLYLYFQNLSQQQAKKPHIDLNPPTSEQIKAGNEIKKQSIEQATKPGLGNDNNQQSSTSLETQVTAASVESDTLYIRNDINGIYATGTCTLTLTKDVSTVTKTSGVHTHQQSST
jgi:hypothetical protein